MWHWGCKPTPGPDANGFASQWNIGFKVKGRLVKVILKSGAS